MKKIFAILGCASILLMCFLPIYAFAHSGKTDGKGGHTDSSTGDYHYHHGYPAHDHYDMDGDGIADCPYNFDNKTGQSSGGVSNNSSTQIGSSNKINSTTSKKEEVDTVPTFINWVIGILAFVILCLLLIIRSKNETIERNERTFRRLQKDEETKVKESLTSLHQDLVAHYGAEYLHVISGAMLDDFLDENNYPHNSEEPAFDQYTFYLGGHPYGSDVKYHHRSCRYARSSYPVNAMYLRERRHFKPCMLCPCGLPDTSWVEKYKKHSEFLKKYEVDLKRI